MDLFKVQVQLTFSKGPFILSQPTDPSSFTSLLFNVLFILRTLHPSPDYPSMFFPSSGPFILHQPTLQCFIHLQDQSSFTSLPFNVLFILRTHHPSLAYSSNVLFILRTLHPSQAYPSMFYSSSGPFILH